MYIDCDVIVIQVIKVMCWFHLRPSSEEIRSLYFAFMCVLKTGELTEQYECL